MTVFAELGLPLLEPLDSSLRRLPRLVHVSVVVALVCEVAGLMQGPAVFSHR